MKSLKGSLLVAGPGLLDPNFCRSVVFLAEHNTDGAFGLIINRPAELKVADIWDAIADETSTSDVCVFQGGPVQKNAVMVLHGCPELATEAEPLVPGVYLGSEVELLGELLRKDVKAREESPGARPPFRVLCGYAGWGEGQLDSEMKAGGWLTYPASAELVFHDSPQDLWNVVLEAIGGVYRFFSRMPRNPEHN